MEKGLWASEDKFISFSELKKQKQSYLLNELYSSSAIDGSDPASFLGLLPDPDPVLLKTGDGVSVLRSLTADDKVISSIQNRKLGTLKKQNYLFEPGKQEDREPDSASRDICAALRDDLKDIDLYNIIAQVLEAPYYGMTPVEIIWKSINGRLRIDKLLPRPVSWFGFNEKHEAVFSGDMSNAPVVREKMIIARHFPDAENPYGLRLLSRCLWPVAFKKGGLKFWIMLCERFGMPWVIGHTHGDKASRQETLSMLTAMVQNAVAVVSGDTQVDVHTFSGKGGDLHSALIRHCDTAIARVLQGQSLTNEGGSTGSYAESKTSRDVLGDFREADEHLVVSFMNDLARIYTGVNSANTMAPVFRYKDPEDYTALANLDKILYGVGVRFTEDHFKRKYRMADDEFSLEPGGNPVEPGGNPDKNKEPDTGLTGPGTDNAISHQFSSGQDQDAFDQDKIDAFCSDLAEGAAKDTKRIQKAVLEAVMKSDNYDDAACRILELYPSLSIDRFEEIMEKALFNSTLFGMYTAGKEDVK